MSSDPKNRTLPDGGVRHPKAFVPACRRAFTNKTERVMRTSQLSLHVLAALVAAAGFLGCKSVKLTQKPPHISNGGRAEAVASDPSDDNIIVVASSTGGLYRSYNGGDTWRQTSRDATFRFRDVLFLPTDPDIVLAAAGVDTRVISGGGIYRSTNGGLNWTKATMNAPTSDCTNNMGAHALSFDESNGRLWAGADCGLFYSDDLGATWDFLSPATGLGSGSIRAVLTPAANKMVVLTDNGIRVSANGGGQWTTKVSGLPGNRSAGQQNQIASSPLNSNHIFFAFNHWEFTTKWEKRIALYLTKDFGDHWDLVDKLNGWNRPPFVVLSSVALSGSGAKYDLYWGNGGCKLQRREVRHGPTFGFGPWATLTVDHCDASDLAIGKNGKTPILLISDGGIHKTSNNGANWTMIAAGQKGYRALQITEVTGQKTTDDGKTDLYFATQDNDNWGSPDYGFTWPNKKCCEGFYLTVPRQSLPASQTTHTGVSCSGCSRYKSGPALTSLSGWNDPPRNNGNPALISPAKYVQVQYNPDSTARRLAVSTNTGGNWTSTATVSEKVLSLPLVAGPVSNPSIYVAIEKPGETNGAPNIGLRRITGVLGSTYVVSELTGFGNVGTFPTMFAWYEVFGVNPANPNFIIVPDISTDTVRTSKDGGISWHPDNNLTGLVTNSGEFKFHWDRFSQISSFGWDPECYGHIMVGTQQAGIFQTFDSGKSWEKVKGSENIPYVSSFFFAKKGEVVISSYGRGLWRFRYGCPPPIVLYPPIYEVKWPLFWFKGHITRLKDLIEPPNCKECVFVLAEGGNITDVVVDGKSGKVGEIFVDGGSAVAIGPGRERSRPRVKVTRGPGTGALLRQYEELDSVVNKEAPIKGVYLNGDVFNGVILYDKDVTASELPQRKPEGPKVRLGIADDVGMPIGQTEDIVLIGTGFDPGVPVQVIVDGTQTEMGARVRMDSTGRFRLSIPPTFGIGNHVILIRQETPSGIVEDRVDVRFTVADYPEGEREK